MILYLTLVGFALLLARKFDAGPLVWKLIPAVAVVLLVFLCLLPESNPYAVDAGSALRQLGWIAAIAVPVTLYAMVIRYLRKRTGLEDEGLRGGQERIPALRGLVQIAEDAGLRADTLVQLSSEMPEDTRKKSFAWRSDDGLIVGHLAVCMLGGSAELELLHVQSEHRSRGTGSELLNAGETQAREWGAVGMTAMAGNWQNHAFLESRGYRVIAGQDLGDGLARYWMKKDLA